MAVVGNGAKGDRLFMVANRLIYQINGTVDAIAKAGGFSDLNFQIPANTTVAFTGASGSGKSTILNLNLQA